MWADCKEPVKAHSSTRDGEPGAECDNTDGREGALVVRTQSHST